VTVYYASPTGSDANNGLSTGAPKTLNGGYAVCNAGDTLRLLPGTYQQKFTMNRSGTSGNPITVTSHDSNDKAVISGGGTNVLANSIESALITITGSYNTLDGVDAGNYIRYEANGWGAGQPTWGGYAVYIEAGAGHNTLIRNNFHDTGGHGIVCCGPYVLIEDNDVHNVGVGLYYYIGLYPPNIQSWGSGIGLQTRYDLSQGGAWATNKNIGGTVKNNRVYNIYGEGIIIMRQYGASSTISVHGNEVRNCMSPHLYVTNSDHVDVYDNIVSAPDYAALFGTVRGPGRGLCVGNEYPNNQNSDGCRYLNIYNNLVYGTACPLTYFLQTATGGFAQLADTVIAYNHFLDGKQGGGGYGNVATTVNFTAGTLSNVQFRNNVVTQTNGSYSVAAWNTTTGITFSNNRWGRTPGYTLGSGDSVGDPQIALAGPTNPITKEYFRPISGSVLLGAGTPVSGLTLDYEGTARSGTAPTIGALENVSGVSDWTTVPSPWTGTDVGAPSPTGSKQYSPSLDSYRIISYNSADIWSTSDQFGYIYQSVSDAFELVYNVESYSGGGTYAKFGSVLRTSLAANSASVGFLINPNFGTTQVPWRASDGATTTVLIEYATLDRWHKVSRSSGGVVSFSTSTDGVNWTFRSTISNTVVGTSPLYIGLAVCAQSVSLTSTGIFSGVSLLTSEGAAGTILVDSSISGLTVDAEILAATGTIQSDVALVGYTESHDIEQATGNIQSDFDLVGTAFNEGDDFMTTAGDIIRSALLLNGAVASDQIPTVTEYDDALVALNNMIESWSLDGTVVFAVTQYTTPTVAGVDSVILTTRPVKILAARITDTAGIDHAIAEVGWDDYSIISNKSVKSAYPMVFWCNYAFSAPTVKFWPVPEYAYTVTFMVHLPFYEFSALDAPVSFPPGFERALRYNLAVELAQYGGALPPKVEDIARESLMLLKIANARQTTLQNDSVFINRAGRTNIYSNIT
jgi:hypothetical protein